MSTETESDRLAVIWNSRRSERLSAFFSEFFSNPKGLVGFSIVCGLVLIAIFAPYIVPHDPYKINVLAQTKPPSVNHPFGTDNYGRDVLSRVIMGTRISLYVGILSVGIAVLIGVPLGAISGYYRGYTDEGVMRVMDAMMSFPPALLALVIMAVLGPTLTNVLLALGFVYIPFFARVTRSATMSTANEAYVDAARARGENDLYIIFREILPNAMAPIFVQGSITFAFAIITAAALSFLGMGTQPPTASWGLMISNGRGYLNSAWWMAVFPGVAIGITVLGFNMLGDALRDVLDPKVGSAGGRS